MELILQCVQTEIKYVTNGPFNRNKDFQPFKSTTQSISGELITMPLQLCNNTLLHYYNCDVK